MNPTTSRNTPCPCGSGKRYRQCCMPPEERGGHLQVLPGGGNASGLPVTPGAIYEAWVRQPLPELGGKTPLQLTRSKKGREQVEALLRDMERLEARRAAHGRPAYDFTELRRLLKLPIPEREPTYNELGLLADADELWGEGQFDEAEEHYRYLLETCPNAEMKMHCLTGLALLCNISDRVEEGFALAEEAVKLDEHWPPARAVYGVSLSRLGRPAEAIPHLEYAAQEIGDAIAYGELGFAYLKLGRLFEAERALRRCTELEPLEIPGWKALAGIYLGSGRLFEAKRVLELALKKTGGDAELEDLYQFVLSELQPQPKPPFYQELLAYISEADALMPPGWSEVARAMLAAFSLPHRGNARAWAAALYYAVARMSDLRPWTQKELAGLFGTNANALRTCYRALVEGLGLCRNDRRFLPDASGPEIRL